MLAPTLQALAFLHGREWVQGQLKPSNILVVGEGLKLASDTIRPAGEFGDSVHALSAYDPPEARHGMCSGAGDTWALGITLCEALTRRRPSGLRDGEGGVVLPPDLSPAFSELVARCLSRRPYDRPGVADVEVRLWSVAAQAFVPGGGYRLRLPRPQVSTPASPRAPHG